MVKILRNRNCSFTEGAENYNSKFFKHWKLGPKNEACFELSQIDDNLILQKFSNFLKIQSGSQISTDQKMVDIMLLRWKVKLNGAVAGFRSSKIVWPLYYEFLYSDDHNG